MNEVVWLEEALQDLDDIGAYIAREKLEAAAYVAKPLHGTFIAASPIR